MRGGIYFMKNEMFLNEDGEAMNKDDITMIKGEKQELCL